MKIAALVALAGIATLASAQVNQIDIKARIVGTTDWVDSINFVSINNNDPLNLEVAVFYNWTSGVDGGVAFSGVTHSVTTSGWNVGAGDTAQFVGSPTDGRQGRFNFGGQTQAFFTTGIDAGRLRIGAVSNAGDVAGGGISIKQNTPTASGTLLDTGNPVLAYRFNISIACDDLDDATVRSLLIDAPLNKVSTTYGVYRDLASTSVLNRKTSLLATDGVDIRANWIIPAPASMALLGLGGLVIGRRRR